MATKKTHQVGIELVVGVPQYWIDEFKKIGLHPAKLTIVYTEGAAKMDAECIDLKTKKPCKHEYLLLPIIDKKRKGKSTSYTVDTEKKGVK